MGAVLASEATDVTKSCNPPPPPTPTSTPTPPSCIKAGSVNCLAAPLRTPRSAVSEWTKWLMTALRHCACLRQMETGAAADALQHQVLLPSTGLTHQLWTVSCQTVSAWWLVTLRVRYRTCSPLLGCRRMMNHMDANGTLHKTQPHKRHISTKGKCDRGLKFSTQRVIENLETHFTSSVCVIVIRWPGVSCYCIRVA